MRVIFPERSSGPRDRYQVFILICVCLLFFLNTLFRAVLHGTFACTLKTPVSELIPGHGA